MTRSHRKRIALVFFLLALLIGVPVVSTWRVVRQKQINRDLITAVERNDTSAAIRLLDAGADPTIKTISPSVSFVQSLRDLLARLRGVPWTKLAPQGLDSPLLTQAVYRGNVRLAVSLLNHGAQVDAEYCIYGLHPAPSPMTSLMFAVQNNSDDLVRVLIAHGANVNWKDRNGITSLMVAPDATIMNLLLDHGADIHARTTGTYPSGLPPIFMHDDSPALMRLLLARGANINERADDGVTLVMDAAEYGRIAGIRFGLDHGVDVNARDRDGHTALMYAIEGDTDPYDTSTVEAVKILLARGANVSARTWGQRSDDPAGSTVLQMTRSPIYQQEHHTTPAFRRMIQVIHLLKAAEAKQ